MLLKPQNVRQLEKLNNEKMIKYLLLAIAILSLSTVALFYKWRTAEEQRAQTADFALHVNDTISYYKNKAGEEVAKRRALELDYSTFKTLSKSKDLEWVKEFQGLKSSLNNLQEATRINTQSIADFTTTGKESPPVVINHVPHEAFTFENKDEYITETGTVVPDLKLVTSHITVNVPLEGVVYWQRPHKFLFIRWGKKKYFTEFKSHNPHTKITQIESLVIKSK